MSYSIGEVARMSGVSIRMLRHYDEIGLLTPRDRTVSGYRQYTDDDLLRLQRIVSYKSTGMALAEITSALANDREIIPTLEEQERLIRAHIEKLQTQLVAVERTRRAHVMGINLTPDEIFEVFGEDDPTQYADEVKERWGDADAYKESQRRTTSYTKADWEEAQADAQRAVMMFVAAMNAGLPADSPEAMAAAEAHREQISRWYYQCSYDMQTGLAAMYLADPRFTENYEKVAVGLAQYVHDAIYANALANS
jgi:DNA-binding transcriptional MerR regulator